ncbi:MAG: HD domain-containing protein [Ktedonobacterales bacterium]|nr:HD domain-containing protein [Ktedonobacterales bacterium]
MSNKAVTSVGEALPGTRRYTRHTIHELGQSIRERDLITYEHCRRVAIYAQRLARSMGWPRRAARDLALAGLVHDLGKTWMENSILHKDSALSKAEWHEMHRHPRIAARMLLAYGVPDELVRTVLYHHESYDGHGYPDELAGSDIPIGARLLTVVDVFDALTSARSYKSAMSLTAARDRIAAGAGTHFDPEVAAAFIHLLDTWPDFLLPVHTEPLEGPDAHSLWARHDYFPI